MESDGLNIGGAAVEALPPGVATALSLTAERQRAAAVMSIDLDHFRAVNELLGEVDGNALLRQTEERLNRVLRPGDILIRPLADEFVVVLPILAQETDAAGIAARLQQALLPSFRIGERTFHITASIGVALFQRDGAGVDVLLRNARAALREAKQSGRNTVRFFDAAMNRASGQQLDLVGELGRAIQAKELQLHYQPMVDLTRDGRVYGFEALLRWNHPRRGQLLPAEFIPQAEESGLIVPIGEWVLGEACRQGRLWREAFNPDLRMAVNLSARQFASPDLVESVARTLTEVDFPARNLSMDITESLLMRDVEQSVSVLQRFKGMGVAICMDDFGTGYSSLSYLRRFPLSQIKIDRSFVADLSGQPDDATICASIIAMAHALRLKVVAVGVETEAQLGFLLQHRCQAMQGFLFSQPLTAEAATALLREGRQLALGTPGAEAPPRRLLLLDDEENVLSSLKRLFRRDGYEIHAATDAGKAFEMLAEHPIGVVISDQRMPGMSGTEFLRRVKDLYPDTIRIVLSGYTELQAATDAINEGAIYRFLTKPWDDNQLRTAIRDAFLQQELARENDRLDREARQANAELARMNGLLQGLLEEKSRRIARDATVLGVAQEAVDHVPVPVIGVDGDGMVVLANAAAARLVPGLAPGGLTCDLPDALARCLDGACLDVPQRLCLEGREWLSVKRGMGQQSGSTGWLLMLVPPELADLIEAPDAGMR